MRAVPDSAYDMLTETLQGVATETKETAALFAKTHRGLLDQNRYFRFNVKQGLQDVGLEEYRKIKEIVTATGEYGVSGRTTSSVELRGMSEGRIMYVIEPYKRKWTELDRGVLT